MPSYSCFFCPSEDRTEKALTDQCPSCGRTYGLPLKDHPSEINGHRVVETLDRGFYSATYLCRRGALGHAVVLKVVPVSLYAFHNKDFAAECRAHAEICAGTEHVQKIEDYFQCTLPFGGEQLECHVAVLEYVEGKTLQRFLREETDLKGGVVAQLAIDLLNIHREFASQDAYHNDLHDRNIIVQQLPADMFRSDIPGVGVRAVVIDLGSLGGESRSDECGRRLSDQHQIAGHLASMAKILRESNLDADVRLAEAIDGLAALYSSPSLAQRLPDHNQATGAIRDARLRSSEYPWAVPLRLAQFKDHYNAQTLDPWYVPLLLVDPQGMWVDRIASSGPLIITGMRGCGKTMVLRALQFHARACWQPKEPREDTMRRLREDGYVGLYLSCVRLLVKPGRHVSDITGALERLFLAYGIEAIRAARHVSSLDSSTVAPDYAVVILKAVNDSLSRPVQPIDERSESIERALLRASFDVDGDPLTHQLTRNAAHAFDALAEALRSTCAMWRSHRVLYLLDDVSTRYLRDTVASGLFSTLLFQSPSCAFKMTTEAQTWLAVLRSPGLIERARPGRDYDTFDLGEEVYQRTRQSGAKGGKWFIEQILQKRIPYYSNHPKVPPSGILGDAALEQIGRDIVQTRIASRRRKKREGPYRGLSALAAVCVGDIGEVISIYDLMLSKLGRGSTSLPQAVQSDSYQQYCSHRLFELSRHKGEHKDFALGFAQASHDLLIRSAQTPSRGGRLRQYSKVYVRLTTGDTDEQFTKLRDLIDAGIFVFNGGGPRQKTAAADPTYNFALAYRKLYGLTALMGLADSDRFEVSGRALEDWLDEPTRTKEILLRSLGGPLDDQPDLPPDDDVPSTESSRSDYVASQLGLFPAMTEDVEAQPQRYELPAPPERWIVEEIESDQIACAGIEQIVLGLGFEDRTLESARRLLGHVRPSRAILIRYPEPGKRDGILSAVNESDAEIEEIPYETVRQRGLDLRVCNTLVDVTGLAKPALFSAVRSAFSNSGQIWIARTKAQQYYPADDEILRVKQAAQGGDPHDLLEALGRLFTGEREPYTIMSVHSTPADPSRRRTLCTFASAKHQRILWLLDSREYDHVDIAVPPVRSQREDVARIGAEMAVWNAPSAKTFEVDPDDMQEALRFLLTRYSHWFVNSGYNFEIGLTGSKMEACAAAIWTVLYGATECLYVQPAEFDPNRFTTGVGVSTYHRVCAK